jgi:hypothetical protein
MKPAEGTKDSPLQYPADSFRLRFEGYDSVQASGTNTAFRSIQIRKAPRKH